MIKIIRRLSFIILLIFLIQPVASAVVDTQGIRFVISKKSSSTRPSLPPTQEEVYITCTIYDDGYAEFGLPFNMYTVYVKFINPEGEEEVEGFVTHREPYISIEGLSGEYTVVCLPVGGDPYEGTVYV